MSYIVCSAIFTLCVWLKLYMLQVPIFIFYFTCNSNLSVVCLICAAADLSYYASTGTEESDNNYIFYLNVCGRVTTSECGEGEFISSCQVKKSGNVKKVAGRFQNQTLR